MPPGTNDVDFVYWQVGRIFIDKRLDEAGVTEESVTDFEAEFRRQSSELFGAGEFIGNHLEALVHEEHQPPVQLEEEFDILWGEKHWSSPV